MSWYTYNSPRKKVNAVSKTSFAFGSKILKRSRPRKTQVRLLIIHFGGLYCIHQNTEAKRKFATHTYLSVKIRDSQKHLKPWSDMWLTFKFYTSCQSEFVRKSQIDTIPITVSHSREFHSTITSLQVTPFCCPIYTKYAQQTSKREQVPAA